MSGEVFSQSSRSMKKKKVRTVQVEEKPNNETTTSISETNGKARIDTKDGAMYLGEFINETDDTYTIKIITDDTLHINKEEVRRAKTPNNAIVFNRGKYHPTTGMFLHYSAGFNAGISGGGFIADVGLGYRLSKHWELSTGFGFIGTSVDLIPTVNSWGEYKTFFPGYLGAQYNITHGKVRLYASTKAGYSTAPLETFNEFIWGGRTTTMSGGVYLEPGLGLTFASKRVGRTSIAITQVLQRSHFTINTVDRFDNLVTGSGKVWLSRVGVRLTTNIF